MIGLPDLNSSDAEFSAILDFLRSSADRTTMSLPQYTQRTAIFSRVFIQENILDESVLPDLYVTMQNLYTGWILTALQLNERIDATRTVNQLLATVATEKEQYAADYQDVYAAIEHFSKAQMITGKPTEMTPKEPVSLASGKVIEVTFRVDENRDIKVNLMVQLFPKIIQTAVAEQFLALNFRPSMYQRWVQFRTGEISFFKDFLFESDLLAGRRKAMKQDSSDALHDMLKNQNNSLANAWKKMLVAPDRKNVASTIFIFEKNSFDKFCHLHGCNFDNYDQRTKFFNRTFAMIVAVIDPIYSKVQMYFHGIKPNATFSYNQLAAEAKKEKYDLMDIMKTYSQGQAPKF